MTNAFNHSQYVIRRKVFKMFGGAFHIYDPSGNVAFYSKQAAFKIREDIRLYSSEDMSEELLRIAARKVIDFSAAYDVFDSASGQHIGTLQRKGWKSMVADEWIIADSNGTPMGTIKEENVVLAILRRFVNFIPQSFVAEIGGAPVATFNQRFNPFVLKIDVDFSADTQNRLDRRVGIAASVLLSAVEGRQK